MRKIGGGIKDIVTAQYNRRGGPDSHTLPIIFLCKAVHKKQGKRAKQGIKPVGRNSHHVGYGEQQRPSRRKAADAKAVLLRNVIKVKEVRQWMRGMCELSFTQ